MRVTQSMMYRNFLENIGRLNEKLEQASQQVSSGKKLGNLQDSPAASAEAVQLRKRLSDIDQYRENTGSGSFYLGTAESALSSVHNLATAVFTRGSAAASDTNDTTVLPTLAQEIRSLRDQILSLANTRALGRHIFAGSQVTTPAFTIAGDTVTYQGDGNVNRIQVGEGADVQVNVAGSSVFSPMFASIEALLTAVDSGDKAAIQTALDQFSSGLDTLGQARTQIGEGLARLENAGIELGNRETIVKTRQSRIEDADLPTAVAQLSQIETALRASFTAQSVVQQQNLFDYLG